MKRSILPAIALLLFGADLAEAGMPPIPALAPPDRPVAAPAEQVRVVRRAPPRAWAVGRPYPLWSRMIVRDFVRYGLRAPGPGLVWVRAGNSFLLVRSATGMIVAVR